MTDRQLDLQWVPSDPSQFVTWGSELRHYKVVDKCHYPDSETAGLDSHARGTVESWVPGTSIESLNDLRSAVLLATVSEPHYIQCVDLWHGPAVIVAAGQASGRISFVSFSGETETSPGRFLLDKELKPRNQRHCMALAWHPASDGQVLLAGGYEKHRNDSGLLVWDLAGVDKPLAEIGMTDSVGSIAWFRPTHSLAAGINNKMVRLFDTRTPNKLAGTTMSRATNGLTVDPASDHRLAGHTESTVVIWDTRNFEKPILSLESSGRQVSKLAWCPTRPGLLGSSGRDTASILLYDIMSWAVGQEDGEPAVIERSVTSPVRQELGSLGAFAWHPRLENTLLAVGTWGRFAEWTVSDRLTVNWSARHSLVWSSGRAKLQNMSLKQNSNIEDISVLMETRCREGYAGSGSLADAGPISRDPDLELTWAWAHHVNQMVGEGLVRPWALGVPGPGSKFPGVRAVLQSAGMKPNPQSELRPAVWAGVDSKRTMRVYKSQERDTVLKLCGWTGERELILPSLSPLALTARKAAVAVFNLDLRTALQELKQGAARAKSQGKPDLANILNMVGVAVSGYSSEGSPGALWREMVAGALGSLPDPALKAMFAFLTCQDENYRLVLDQEGLLLVDRVGFAVTFLNDQALSEYMAREWAEMLKAGQVSALMLSGGDSEGVELVQAFVDRTGDVQTASWLAVRILSTELAHTEQVSAWLESYRTILDQWHMFTARAELDIALTAAGNGVPGASQPYYQHQVHVSCHFCGKSVSPWYKGMPQGGSKAGSLSRSGGAGGNKVKLQSCLNCKKPLPRCSVCLVNMGTASGSTSLSPDSMRLPSDNRDKRVSEFGYWFTWCQTCRHGGHAHHLLHWFSQHTDCPVTGCTCKCGQLDSLDDVSV